MESCDATELDLQAANLILNAGHAIDPALLKDTTLSRQSLITRHLAAIVKRWILPGSLPPAVTR